MRSFVLLSLILCSAETWAQKAPNFFFTDTHNKQWSLHEELGKGNTVLLDFFFVDCKPCQKYTPLIEALYKENGGDTGNVVVFGISDRDDNRAVLGFESIYGVTYPSCGYEGGGDTITDLFQLNFSFLAWPTYAVVCPDTTIRWNVAKSDSLKEIRDSIGQCPPPLLGITALNKPISSISLWYNSKTQSIVVNNPKDEDISAIYIFDVFGRLCLHLPYFNSTATLDLRQTNLIDGVYFFHIFHNSKSTVHKLLLTTI